MNISQVRNWWIIFFTILIGISILFTIFSFTLENVAQREFAKQVSIIIIPIVAGGIVAKFTTNSWQITKEKIEIKEKILIQYATSYKRISLLIENYMYKVIEEYIIYTNNGTSIRFPLYDNKDHKINAYISKTISGDKLPSEKFKDEYQKLKIQIYDASFVQNTFFSNIRLHFSVKKLERAAKKLEGLLNNQQDIVQRFMHSTNVDEIINFYTMFDNTKTNVNNKFEEIEDMMVNLKFRGVTL